MNFQKGIIIIAIVFISLSCNPTKKITKEVEPVGNLTQKYESNTLAYDELEMKTSLQYKGAMNIQFDGLFRIKKEELMWGVFRKFGFEAVRIYIDQDSLKIINRLTKTYIAEDIDQLKSKTGVGLTLDDMIAMIIGEPILTGGYIQNSDSTLYQLTKQGKEEFEILHYFGVDQLISKTEMQQLNGNMKLHVFYNDMKVINEASIPFFKEFDSYGEQGEHYLSIETKDINFEVENTYPFSIPSNFTRTYL